MLGFLKHICYLITNGRSSRRAIISARKVVLCLGFVLYPLLFVACAQETNENFELSIEGSVRVTTDSKAQSEARCDPAVQLNCSIIDLVLDDGTALYQKDAFAKCSVTEGGDLRVELTSSSEAESSARVLFMVHQNSSPRGTAKCEGLKVDGTSSTGFLRSSCDVIVQYGRDIFAATPFERCTAIADVDGALRGTISCPLLRTGTRKLIVNKLTYFCAPTDERDAENGSDGEASQ